MRAFSGDGARRWGARWNPPDVPAVYFAGSLALAVLEVLVHFDTAAEPDNLLAIPVVLPDHVSRQRVEAAGLPPGWRETVGGDYCRKLGAAWHKSGRHALLEVPSAVIPLERNYVANPMHEEFERLDTSHYGYPLRFDRRLIGLVDEP